MAGLGLNYTPLFRPQREYMAQSMNSRTREAKRLEVRMMRTSWQQGCVESKLRPNACQRDQDESDVVCLCYEKPCSSIFVAFAVLQVVVVVVVVVEKAEDEAEKRADKHDARDVALSYLAMFAPVV